ncbi:hypothetical protein FBU30_009259 [Linnemannia zychae]|nr:hypothetical protein FBU30_009259 [Linnemannia zychae]
MRFSITIPFVAALASYASAACNAVSFDYTPTFSVIGSHTQCKIEYVMWGPNGYHQVKLVEGTDLFKKKTYTSPDGQWSVTDDNPCTLTAGKLTVKWGNNVNTFKKTSPNSVNGNISKLDYSKG